MNFFSNFIARGINANKGKQIVVAPEVVGLGANVVVVVVEVEVLITLLFSHSTTSFLFDFIHSILFFAVATKRSTS